MDQADWGGRKRSTALCWVARPLAGSPRSPRRPAGSPGIRGPLPDRRSLDCAALRQDRCRRRGQRALLGARDHCCAQKGREGTLWRLGPRLVGKNVLVSMRGRSSESALTVRRRQRRGSQACRCPTREAPTPPPPIAFLSDQQRVKRKQEQGPSIVSQNGRNGGPVLIIPRHSLAQGSSDTANETNGRIRRAPPLCRVAQDDPVDRSFRVSGEPLSRPAWCAQVRVRWLVD